MEEIICSICCESVRTVPSIDEDVKTTLNLNRTPTKVCLLLCNHLFHSKCILMHLDHKRNCPNCRSLVAADKMIFIPDALITMEKVQTDLIDLNLKSIGLPRDKVLKRLHKDLQQREEQIEELELRLEQGQYLDESGNDNFEVRHELETQRLENIHLAAEVSRVRNELGIVKIDLERSSMNVSQQKWQISQREAKIKDLTSDNELKQNQIQELISETKCLKNKLHVYQTLDSISIEFKSSDEDWNAKIDRIVSVDLDSKDYKRFIIDMAKKLKDTSDRYHTFREHAMKLKEKLKKKEEIEALNVQYRQQIQELEYKIQEITLKNTAVDFCMDTRREPEELIVKAPNLSSVCRPGAFGAKRRIETVGNTMEMVSNGMGGSRRARIDIPPLIPSPQVKMNLSTSGKTISKLTMLNKSNLALNSLPKKPSVMSKWLGRN